MDLSSIGIGSLFRTSITAMVDSMGSTFPKAAVAALEDEQENKASLARQLIVDEGPEVFWKTIVGSLFVKTMRNIAPWLPEQIANFPGEMLGAFIHWASSAHQSKGGEVARNATGNENKEPTVIENFFNTCIKTPIDFGLKMVGLEEGHVKPFRFGIINAVLFAGGAYVLKDAEEENIPGMNLDYEDPWYVSLFKTAGYTIFEQIAHCTSQTMRYYIDLKKEFKKDENKFDKDILAKAMANVINERAIPGNIPSAISGCLSTLFLGRYIPKSVAGAFGEAPMKGLERLVTIHKKRGTKDRIDESGNRIKNYRSNSTLDKILEISDSVFDPFREFSINLVARFMRPENISTETYAGKLRETFSLEKESLKKGRNGNGKSNDTNT